MQELPLNPESPTGVLPEALFYPEQQAGVISFLRAAPVYGVHKLAWFDGWTVWTQASVAEDVRVSVLHSGIDY